MIKSDDCDLFGGRLSIITSDAFSCQVETVSRELCSVPITLIVDLNVSDGVNGLRPVVRLTYHSPWSNDVLTGHHQSMVEFLDGLPAGRKEISFASALDMVSREFSDLGNWEWLRNKEFSIRVPESPARDWMSGAELLPGHEFRRFAATLSPPSRLDAAADYRAHMDSPLAG